MIKILRLRTIRLLEITYFFIISEVRKGIFIFGAKWETLDWRIQTSWRSTVMDGSNAISLKRNGRKWWMFFRAFILAEDVHLYPVRRRENGKRIVHIAYVILLYKVARLLFCQGGKRHSQHLRNNGRHNRRKTPLTL